MDQIRYVQLRMNSGIRFIAVGEPEDEYLTGAGVKAMD